MKAKRIITMLILSVATIGVLTFAIFKQIEPVRAQDQIPPPVPERVSFGMVGITLKNGDRIDGTLKEETDTELVVLSGTPVEARRLKKSDIAERTDPVSAMPPLGLILKPREVRDLVEFLSGLR